MKAAAKSPESAVYRRGLGIFVTETPPTDTPQHLFRPLFPALWSDPMALSGASRKKQIPCSFHSKVRLKVNLNEDKIELIYGGVNKIYSKVIQGNKILEQKESVEIKSLYQEDNVKFSSVRLLENWYDNSFIFAGISITKKASKKEERKDVYLSK